MTAEKINSKLPPIPDGLTESVDVLEATGDGFQSVSLSPNHTDGDEADFFFSFDVINFLTLKRHQLIIRRNTQKLFSLREVYQILLEELGGQPIISGYVSNFGDVQELVGKNADARRLTAQLIRRVCRRRAVIDA